jgi:hypothetical protein
MVSFTVPVNIYTWLLYVSSIINSATATKCKLKTLKILQLTPLQTLILNVWYNCWQCLSFFFIWEKVLQAEKHNRSLKIGVKGLVLMAHPLYIHTYLEALHPHITVILIWAKLCIPVIWGQGYSPVSKKYLHRKTGWRIMSKKSITVLMYYHYKDLIYVWCMNNNFDEIYGHCSHGTTRCSTGLTCCNWLQLFHVEIQCQ